jgi:hypothetical protein
MKLNFPFTAAIVILAAAMSAGHAQQVLPGYKSIQPSGGRPFPANEADLLRLRDDPSEPNISRMRMHAWDLFVGLTEGEPAWETWYTKCNVKLVTKGCLDQPGSRGQNIQHLLPDFEIPAQSLQFLEQLFVPSGAAPDAQDPARQTPAFRLALKEFIADYGNHPQFASVLFNYQAANHILKECLYPQSADRGQGENLACPGRATARRDIAAFPRDSIVLKTVWEVARKNSEKGSGLAGPIDTWSSSLWNRVHSSNFDPKSLSKTSVMIDAAKAAECDDRDYQDGEAVPLGCFYSHKLTQEDIDLFPHLLAEINVHHLVAGDYLILVGMHVTTKEIPEWVWATFWWDNHSFSDRHKAGRPPNLGINWRHFLMETTLSGYTPLENDGGPKIVFNPYLETAIANGVISNCLQCHREAAYGYKMPVNPYELGILGRDGKSLASGKALVPGYPGDGVQTDFLWSIADAQNPNIQALLGLLEIQVQELQMERLHRKGLRTTPTAGSKN